MKVLLVNCVYQFGSTGKIIRDLRFGLEALGCNVYIAYGRGAKSVDKNIFKLCSDLLLKFQSLMSKVSGYSYGCSPFSTSNLKRLIADISPDIVNLHCINANTLNITETLQWLKSQQIPTVVSEHAEFMHTGGCGYAMDCNKWLTGCNKCPQFHKKYSNLPTSYFFDRTSEYWKALKKSFYGFSKLSVTGVSPWLTERMKRSPFFVDKVVTPVFNGLDTSIFTRRQFNDPKYEKHFNGKKIILHVTPNFYSPIKGGKYVIEVARKFEKRSDIIICIIGYRGDRTDLPSNVVPIEFTKNQLELAEFYSRADICLLTSERETFSMVTAESLCCGTPVVGFKAGGPESIAIPEYSRFCDQGDIDSLIKNIEFFFDNHQDSESISQEAIQVYSTERMAENYYSVYKNLLKK